MDHVAAIRLPEGLRGVSPSVRRARPADEPALVRLINRAHQVGGAPIDGARTDEAEVRGLAERGHFLVLDADGALAATAYVRADGEAGLIDLLSVTPELRRLGLGTRLMGVAEALCAALGCRSIEIAVVD